VVGDNTHIHIMSAHSGSFHQVFDDFQMATPASSMERGVAVFIHIMNARTGRLYQILNDFQPAAFTCMVQCSPAVFVLGFDNVNTMTLEKLYDLI
jgi:hypothetical protein